jgi:hypothetical protein
MPEPMPPSPITPISIVLGLLLKFRFRLGNLFKV